MKFREKYPSKTHINYLGLNLRNEKEKRALLNVLPWVIPKAGITEAPAAHKVVATVAIHSFTHGKFVSHL